MSQHTHNAASGGIRRGPRRADHFTPLSNAVLNDERLSFRARGVLTWLLSKPADWSTRSDAIAAHSPKEGREAIRTAMRELEQLGYLVREKEQDERGRWSTFQTIYEEPVTRENPSPEPEPRKPGSGKATFGKPGAFTKDGTQRTKTNNNTPKRAASRVKVLGTDMLLSDAAHKELTKNTTRYDELVRACVDAGLVASFEHVKPAQKAEILSLIDVHGVGALVQCARSLHRDTNPTLYAQGWLRAWNAMPLPRATPAPAHVRAPKCSACEGTRFVLNANDEAVPCGCRAAA